MTLESDLRELVRQVVREELAANASARKDAPERLLDVDEARSALGGIARSTLYQLIGTGELRTLTIGRRRLIPASAIAEYAGGR